MSNHRIPFPVRSAALAAALLLSCALSAAAQGRNVPGAVGTDPHGESSAYGTEVSRQVADLVGQWRDAWQNDDAGVVSSLYARDAVLVLGEEGATRSRGQIEQRYRRELPRLGAVQTERVDFGFSGEIAYEVGQFSYAVEQPAPGESPVRTGRYVVIARRVWDGTWQIRSHTLADDAPPRS